MIRALVRLVWFVLRRSVFLASSIGILGALIGFAFWFECVPHRGAGRGDSTSLAIFWIAGLFQLGLVLGYETAFEPEPDEAFTGMLRRLPAALLLAVPGLIAWGAVAFCAGPAIQGFFTRCNSEAWHVPLLVAGAPAMVAWCFYGLLPFACALRGRAGLIETGKLALRIRREFRWGFSLVACVPFLAFYITMPEIIAATEDVTLATATTFGTIRVVAAIVAPVVAIFVAPAGAVAAQALFARVAAKMPPATSPSRP